MFFSKSGPWQRLPRLLPRPGPQGEGPSIYAANVLRPDRLSLRLLQRKDHPAPAGGAIPAGHARGVILAAGAAARGPARVRK